jgi:hypothetical protein
MRRLTCAALAVVIAAVVAVRPVQATYVGTLQQGSYTLEVTTAAQVAITILVVTSRGRLDVEETLLSDAGTGAQNRTIPRNAVRIIFKADALQGTNSAVKIKQGNTLYEVPVNSHDDIVADVIQPQ